MSLPWSNIIKSPGSSVAPGPPNASCTQSKVKPRNKVPKKVAQKLEQMDSTETNNERCDTKDSVRLV